jgi:eukaryotic-like serine/threonine-protein kinase
LRAWLAGLKCRAIWEKHKCWFEQGSGAVYWLPSEVAAGVGISLAGQKRYAEAEPLLLQAYQELKALEASIPVASRGAMLANAKRRLVQLYEAWGKPEQARKWRDEPAPPGKANAKPAHR